jgi:hypothetical protein
VVRVSTEVCKAIEWTAQLLVVAWHTDGRQLCLCSAQQQWALEGWVCFMMSVLWQGPAACLTSVVAVQRQS